ncbi:glutaredoxin domain-containing protein [Dermabacteraceae bacterium CCM 9519]
MHLLALSGEALGKIRPSLYLQHTPILVPSSTTHSDIATVYSLPDCSACSSTKKAFERYGIEYREVDLSLDPGATQRFKESGFLQAPIVVVEGYQWSGFRPDKIRTYSLRCPKSSSTS